MRRIRDKQFEWIFLQIERKSVLHYQKKHEQTGLRVLDCKNISQLGVNALKIDLKLKSRLRESILTPRQDNSLDQSGTSSWFSRTNQLRPENCQIKWRSGISAAFAWPLWSVAFVRMEVDEATVETVEDPILEEEGLEQQQQFQQQQQQPTGLTYAFYCELTWLIMQDSVY